MALLKPPDYLVDGVLQRGATCTLTGNTGHCKTLVALLLAIKVARGDWFCGKKCRQGFVAFFAGENPENVRVQFYSLCSELDIYPASLPIVWHEGVFDLDQAREGARQALRAYPDLALCIFDSLQAFFTGDDDSQNMAMFDTAIDFRAMAENHPNRPSVLILAHPTKNARRDSLLPRGGSALTNELDGNLTCWLSDESNIVVVHWYGKHRGIPFDPIKLEKAVINPQGLVDAEGNQMPCTVVRSLGPGREGQLAQQSEEREIKTLAALQMDPSITQSALSAQLGISRSTIQRVLAALKKQKWVREYSGKYRLTKEGETALELAGLTTKTTRTV